MTAPNQSPISSTSPPKPGPARSDTRGQGWWTAFRSGLTQPSLAGLLGALAVAFVWFAGACGLFNDRFLASRRPGSLMLDSKDSIARASVIAVQGAAQHARGFTVCIGGTSDTEELIARPDWLEQRFADQGSPGVHIVRLCAAALMLEEQRALIERFGADFNGVFVLGVGPQLVSRPTAALADRLHRYRMPFRSGSFDDECRRAGLRPPPRTGIDFLDNVRFYLQHTACLRAPWQPDREFGTHALHKDESDMTVPPLDEKECQVNIEEIPRNLACLARTVDFIRAQGRAQIVLVDIPRLHLVDGRWKDPRWKPGMEAYRAAIREFATARQLPLVNVTDEAALKPEDFYNTGHIGKESARQRYGTALVRALLPHLNSVPTSKPSGANPG